MTEEEKYIPTPAEEAYVEKMAEVVIGDLETKRKFRARRNRSAFKRMNRPHQLIAQEKGSQIHYRLLDKFAAMNDMTGP